ncbi:uncharacterized protein LOC115009287 isoform X2 [Cottoperca gobio]|uniref:Uncharacterized protein LOC115009287 isoform X2 n=1 Tax=Cottoperca gobio TaxID=56716 RepID=A0A6J2PUN5_COTGO|nr:uncharacterized protein LOC115009287 isoform X2 [Cottoperca gobio]
MEGIEMQPASKCSQNLTKLPLWIIEYSWAHKMMEVQEVVDPCNWPEVDSQPLNLEDSWRLRVASARVYSTVKNRDMEHFERALGFLEATYRLLPRLVSPIKHMKIMFGLKTMVIMWMLREGRGMVDTVFKISKFFPSKLPQYQDQCSQHKIFLMRKNHLDFKALAQVLALDKDTCKDYVKLLKKEIPASEEEKLLLEAITSDSMNIATTLKKLLRCDVVSCRRGKISQSSAHGMNGLENSQLSKSVLFGSSSKALLQTEEDGEVVKRVEEDSGDKENKEFSESSSEHVQEAASSPQFCSKHQRWVRSILQECSEELPLQANVSLSPLLFQSSSSITSSQDLTPSDLIPCPPDQQPSKTSTHLPTAAQASEQANPKDEQSAGSASDASQTELMLQPSSSRDTRLPILLSPVVRLIDIASIRMIYHSFKPHQAPLNPCTMYSNKHTFSTSSLQMLTSPHRPTLGNNALPRGTMKQSVLGQPDTVVPTNPQNTTYKSAPVSQDAPTSTRCQTPIQQSFSKLSTKSRKACTTARHSQALDRFSVSGPPTEEASTSTSPSGTLSSVCADIQFPLSSVSSRQVVPQNSIKPHPHTPHISPFQSKTLPCSTVISSASNSDRLVVRSETSRVQRAELRLSLASQAVLLQSKLLQPYVTLNRLSVQECYRVTKWRSSTRYAEPVVQGSNDDNDEDRRVEEEKDAGSLDLNTLYTSQSSSSDEDSLDCDPDYKPCFKKKRLLLEYETARSLHHV